VQELPKPKDEKELINFLGLCACYSQFISGLAYNAKQLRRLTEQKQVLHWSSEVEAAFWSLKETLCQE
jgi:hypothetical protein